MSKKILNIVTSINGENSFTIKLSNAIIDKLTAVYPDSTIHTRDLTQNPLPHLEKAHYTSFNTPKETRTDTLHEAVKNSDEAVKELMEADIIIIGVPIYNFSVPSTLKSWVDHIARPGVTFTYANGYPEGLVVNKQVYLALASGAIYSEGPMKIYDFADSYLRSILGFIGLTDITTFRVEGIKMPEITETAFPKAQNAVAEFAF
ncbi:NAD(P)H-dependent oxidoreductase [Flavobacterium sp. LS1R49]|uniref:FMN dependent NADH:quinone oxidoreductase n=1 Tax=Flavobacterium shii TaxID=2987687 RepID=A0A9X2YU04_9FLAO|nr:NAD(P)H-dependent oxidoreductase [Flavobacterium shii]MCV9927183.1 NAD(P)H-dependent oxidoreductase [Flavobacterium shii]